MAFNSTKTEVTARNPDLLNDARVRLIEDGVPGTRWNITGVHNVGDFRLLARVNFYGEFYDEDTFVAKFDSANLFDLEGVYAFSDNLEATLGIRNVTDERGCGREECGATDDLGDVGLPYAEYSPFGFNGRFIYGKLRYSFY